MLEIQLNTLRRAERDLAALGLEYAILMKDGTVLGNLKVEPVKAKRKHINDFSDLHLDEQLKSIQIGDVGTFEIPPGVTAPAFQSRLCGGAHIVYGKQNYTTARVGNQIQVLRLA